MGSYVYAVNAERGICCEAYKTGKEEADNLPDRIEEAPALARFMAYCFRNGLSVEFVGEEHDAVKRGVHPDELPPDMPNELRVWTQFNLPFRMGGNPRPFRGAVFPVQYSGEVLGIHLFTVEISDGTDSLTRVVTEDGAIVGDTLEEVREDIEQAPPELLKNQMQQAKKLVAQVEKISADEFVRSYLKSNLKKQKTK